MKKLTRKEKYNLLREAGFSSKEAAQYRSWSDSKVKNKIHNRQRTIKRQTRKQLLIEAGYTKSEANKYMDYSSARIEELIRSKQADLYLVVGYKDKTEMTDGEGLYTVKQANKRRSRKNLIDSILGWIEAGTNQGYIGTYEMNITDNVNREISYLTQKNMLIAYRGKGQDLTKLLALINNMMVLLYTMEEKDMFINDLVNNLEALGYAKSRENARYIKDEFLMHEYGDHF